MKIPFLPKDDREAGRKFLARLTSTPAALDAASKLAAKIVNECQGVPMVADMVLREGGEMRMSKTQPAMVTFTPSGGKPVTFTAKRVTMDPEVEQQLTVSTDAELAEAGRQIAERIDADVMAKVLNGPIESTMAVEWENPGLTLEKLNKLIAEMPKMACGVVCRPEYAGKFRQVVMEHDRDQGGMGWPFTSLPVYENPWQVEDAKIFYDRNKMMEYLKEPKWEPMHHEKYRS